MLKKQKNALMKLIQEHGLPIECFEVTEGEREGHPTFSIKYRNSPFVFIILEDENNFHRIRNIFYTIFNVNFPVHKCYAKSDPTNADIYDSFKQWITNHLIPYIDESVEPDLWQQLKENQLVTGETLGTEETSPFTAPEKVQLKLSINEFKYLIEEKFKPTEKQLDIINARLNYLTDSVERLNRIDWKSLALSTVISIGIALSLSHEQGQSLFALFKQVFMKIQYLLP